MISSPESLNYMSPTIEYLKSDFQIDFFTKYMKLIS